VQTEFKNYFKSKTERCLQNLERQTKHIKDQYFYIQTMTFPGNNYFLKGIFL